MLLKTFSDIKSRKEYYIGTVYIW